MKLLRAGAVVEDPWTRAGEEDALPDGAPVIVSVARWLRDRESLRGRDGRIGVVLASDEPPALIADDMGRFSLICLDFPKFTDGRGYSHARLLRTRYGFAGEIRAVGNVLRDQAAFMRRCGIDAFEVAEDADPADWRAAMAEISVAYQPAAD